MQDILTIENFRPENIRISTRNNSARLLVLLQNDYYGWEASVDDHEVPIFQTNLSFMAVRVPAGNHIVIFNYHPRLIIAGLYITLISLIVSLFIILIGGRTRKQIILLKRWFGFTGRQI